MHKTTIEQDAEAAFDGLQGGETVRTLVMPLWLIFQAYLQQRGALPERLEDIPESCFSPFVKHCEDAEMDDDRLLLMVSALRMILVRSGWKPARLAELVAPRRRVRVGNSETGDYRFKLVAKDR
ncbi:MULTISPECIES: hypothetical protein [Paraburkholderia]|uniref:hypothetical protein n=1 Tax=Paraburkholderia TaxID=1822464 RepID=UPI00225A39EE|nr:MULTISPECIES: hypothetical protein [Paraburkholderia]MCX4177438.1 hypothetical protein [Paraburkholderia madseniana]MDQ6465427.1 hypothetical protein [Paraburkholderia madseniana]